MSLRGNLKCVLSQEAEALVVALCELNSLADQPLGSDEFKDVLEKLAQHPVSRHVVRCFQKWNGCSLAYNPRKMMSLSRVANNIVVETERFIETWGKLVESNRALKFNVVVFDETVFGDPTKLTKVIGDQGNGAVRMRCVREKQLCVQIPFSSNNGRTLFIECIFLGKKRQWQQKKIASFLAPPRVFLTETRPNDAIL